MRSAGAITGLLVLGMFVIPGTYEVKRDLVGGSIDPDAPPFVPSRELDVGTAALKGRVFDEEGKPLAGAIVSLAGSGFWPARSVESQHDGRFRWRQIPAGVYELRVSKGALVAAPLEGLILDPGAQRSFGVKLAQGWTLAGRVVDAKTGTPVRDAEVTVATGALGLHSRETETDARGHFELVGVVGAEQNVYVEATGYIIAGPLSQRRDSPELAVRLERAARIEGRVVDARGRPIAGAAIRAFGEGGEASTPPPGSDTLSVTSGPVLPISAARSGSLAFVGQVNSSADGRFVLDKLRAGSYTVAATHPDFTPSSSGVLSVRAGATRSGVRIVMRPGTELAGRVVDERGQGLEAIPVELRAPGERLPRMAVSGADGSFSFRGVRGEITITALPYDLPPAREVLVIDEDDALVTVELALSSALYTMHGRVVDERGFGVGGALLSVKSKDPQTPAERSAKSDADGTFSVPALPEPPFSLRAEHPAFSPARLSEVNELDGVEVVMAAGVTFLGEVIDDWSGDGLRNARVQLKGPLEQESKTRSDGTFVFRQLPTGTYEVTLSHTDYETQERRVVIEPPRYVDRPQELDRVRLVPGGVVEGEIVDANSEPVAGAEVAWGDPPRWDRASRTDARGAFQLRGVPAGSVWITARHPVAGEDWTDGPVIVRPLETSPGAFIRLPDSILE
jgi:protocatechuate 3,4-dioxygenase beta subunit